jgi:phosphate transport system permease protein
MAGMNYFRQKGDAYIFTTSMALILSLGMVVFMIAVILVKGLGFFWPADLVLVEMKDGTRYLGEIRGKAIVRELNEMGEQVKVPEIKLRVGNRDLYGRDFLWVKKGDVLRIVREPDATAFEREEYGVFFGFPVALAGKKGPPDLEAMKEAHRQARKNWREIEKIQGRMNDLLRPISRLYRELSLLESRGGKLSPEERQRLEDLGWKVDRLEAEIAPAYQQLQMRMETLEARNRQLVVTVQTAEGQAVELPLHRVIRFYQPNRMSVWQKSKYYCGKLWEFVSAGPRESNTEGGVFPAIFGTVLMVMIMSIAVVPFGVLAALYLNEYAPQGPVVRLIRLSVNNLAGVPSIVYGVFGLGFFIYTVGGTIDQLFFRSKLPEPTFGTGGILWASLTLALLTVPVVVVATEEGLLAVPRANREGALALGATKWQMIRKIVIPNATPGILTGLILAISRGAGEVAPLMITGVVKLAPSLPIDGTFPFLHLDRKFMHLGFHIYDVGFQSPNVEAAKPMVYMTALLLITIVVALNLIAIVVRNRLRKRYRTATF